MGMGSRELATGGDGDLEAGMDMGGTATRWRHRARWEMRLFMIQTGA
jgi:hypothetical protein